MTEFGLINLSQIGNMGHIKTTSVDLANPNARHHLDVYTGTITVGANTKADHIFRARVASFVPIAPGVIETVTSDNPNPLLGATATASPASVALDEANTIFAVDGVSLALEQQKSGLPKVDGTPFCLILKIDLAIQRGSLLRVRYQVTTLWSDKENIKPTPTPTLPGDTVPNELTTLGIQFVHWISADANAASGTLHGGEVTLSGPMGTAFFLHDDFRNFANAAFTPQLAETGMVEIVGGRGHSFTLSFGVTLQDPIFHLGSLASVLTFPAGTAVTRLSGDVGFVVAGNVVTGTAANPVPGPDGTMGLSDSNGSIQLTGTFTTITFTLVPNSADGNIPDGVFLQVGGAQSDSG
ncbi:hypothetical protein ABZ299_31150 [Streptomyces sp. NPDC006184]|uniref:hypothetical protein n=1 Tax=Streptomyces sp. NPDC006184 TaxID=3155455 RepID=UPI0033A2D260